MGGCNSWHGGHRCSNPAEYRLLHPDGSFNPGGWICGKCAAEVIEEYAEKLGETWDIAPLEESTGIPAPETTKERTFTMPLQCDRWPPPYTARCPNPALYRLTRTHPIEGVQYLGGPVCAECAGVILSEEENERVAAGGPWDVEEIDPETLAAAHLDPLPENVPTPQGAPRFLYTIPPIPSKVERVTKYQRATAPATPRRRSTHSTIDVAGLNEDM